MPGALVPERHDNTLDGKGWSPMLSRLLGVFVFTIPGQLKFWLCIIHNRILPLQHHVGDHDDYFYTICG